MSNNKKITIIGAGAWGTALAEAFAVTGKDIIIYARNKELAKNINEHHCNSTYLPAITLSRNISATANIEDAVKDADIILSVVPTQFTREAFEKIKPFIKKDAFVVSSSKGIEISTTKILSEVAKEVLPNNPYAVLSGPSFAIEVAEALPTAVTLASTENMQTLQDLAEELSSKSFRPYISNDVIGVEIAGAVKNVIAIACGIVAGKRLGENAKAAVMTRGLAETKRLAVKMGAKPETLLGLAGIGDLTLTCNSTMSRNYSLGFKLGEGKTLEEILSSRNTVAEGATTAKALNALAQKLNIEMPICKAINAILYNGAAVEDIVNELMTRHLKAENE